jgi:thiol-disulfide isomerase/thioredoxin
MKMNIAIIILTVTLITTGCSTVDQAAEESDSAVERIYNLDPQRKFIGQKVENFHFIDLVTNNQLHAEQLFKDKVVFIQSFSVGCPACVQGIKDYNYLYDKYSDKIEVIYMDISPDDTKEIILGTKEEFNGKDWLWAEYQDSLFTLYTAFNIRNNDMTFLVDKNGIIAYADSFSVPLARLENALLELI